MRLTTVALLCFSFLLVPIDFTLARRGIGLGKSSIGIGKTSSRGSGSTHNHGSTHKLNKAAKSKPGKADYPKQPQNPQGGYYPQQPGRAGYPNQYPGGSPYAGGGAAYPGGYGYGGYPGGMNYNYNPNRIPSPRYTGSYGYGGYGGAGGSPFAQSVHGMGMNPSMKSKGFGRGAMIAAGGGAITGMALGYGLGRFPRPHFTFHSPQEEGYYNHYMYRRYGNRSTDANDYSRDYRFSPPPITYDSHMATCMKRPDLFPSENNQGKNRLAPAIIIITTSPSNTTTSTSTIIATAPDNSTGNNASGINDTVVDKSFTSSPTTLRLPDQPKANPLPPASEDLSKVDDASDDADDTVSIVEIGYPALIDQLKSRRCVELYMVYSDDYLKKRKPHERDAGARGGALGMGRGHREVLVVVSGTVLMLLSSNVLMLL